MKISAIIPVYNREQTILRAVESAFNQSFPADEIIVVDDGSSDQTASLVKSHFPQVRIIQQPNKGVSAARNKGIRAAKNDWVALLDSDDEWLPDKLETIHHARQLNPEYSLFHSDEIWIRNGIRVNQMNKHQKTGGHIFKHCLPLCVISPSACVLHRSVFEEIGFFNENLPACEDYDLWLKFCHLHPVFYIEKALIKKYGGHADQLSRKLWGMDRFRIQSLHELMSLNTLDDEQRELTRNMLVKKLRILLKGAIKHNNQNVMDDFTPLLKQYEALTC